MYATRWFSPLRATASPQAQVEEIVFSDPLPIWVKSILIFVLIWSAFPADWSCVAVLAILEMYKKRGSLRAQMREMLLYVAIYAVVSFFFVSKVYALVQIGALFVYPVLKLYNGERGKVKWMKWFFYLYYPIHLIFIGVLRIYLYGDVGLLF